MKLGIRYFFQAAAALALWGLGGCAWKAPLKPGAPSAALVVTVAPTTLSFSPISGRSATIEVVVSGFNADADAAYATCVDTDAANTSHPADAGANAAAVELSTLEGIPPWLEWKIERLDGAGRIDGAGKAQTFHLTLRYVGAEFSEAPVALSLGLTTPPGHAYAAVPPPIRVVVENGLHKHQPMAVDQGNVHAFNEYANTAAGLTRHYRLTGDIVLSAPTRPGGSNWTPIGRFMAGVTEPFAEAFTGSFDGSGHNISGLRVQVPGDERGNHPGLFGALGKGGVVANLGLLDIHVKGNAHVGGLVGTNLGTVANSYATGSVRGEGDAVGGLVGQNRGSITNSYATTTIAGEGKAIGGLVGQNLRGLVSKSYATGAVRGNNHTGGLVGQNTRGTVAYSHATGEVHGQEAVGGLVGLNFGRVFSSYAQGEVRGKTAVGGLIGNSRGGSTLERSYATGAVRAEEAVGGLVGLNLSDVLHNSYATGATHGTLEAGGLVGRNFGAVANSYAAGTVTGQSSIGGLIGRNFIGTVHNCLALGPRTTATAPRTDSLGRLVGSHAGTGTLDNNYARHPMDIRHSTHQDGTGGTAKTLANNPNGMDGQSVSEGTASGQYNNPAFWQTLGWDFGAVWGWEVGAALPSLRHISPHVSPRGMP